MLVLSKVLPYVVVTIATALAVVGVELVLRFARPEMIPPTADYVTLSPDQELGYRLRPGAVGRFHREAINGGERIRWSVNGDGYRGDELSDDGRPRVVVLGDSNIQAVFSELERTFPKRLEARLQEMRGDAVEVVNAGVLGYGPDHYMLRLERDLPALEPDVVVVNVFADNDLGDLLRHRLLELQDGELVRRPDHYNYPFLSVRQRARDFADSLLITRSLNALLGVERPLPRPRPTGSEYLRQLEQLTARTLAAYDEPFSPIMSSDHYDIDIAVAPDSRSAQLKVELMRAVLERIERGAESLGAALLVVVEPSRSDLTADGGEPNTVLLGARPSYDPRRLTSTVERLCREAGIDVVNLFDVFAMNEPETLYFTGEDDHWNDAGQELAARTVAPLVAAKLAQR